MPWLTERGDRCNCKDGIGDFHIKDQDGTVITHECRACGYVCKQKKIYHRCQSDEHEFITVKHGLKQRERQCRVCGIKSWDKNKLPKPLPLAELMTMKIAENADPPLTLKQRIEIQRNYQEQIDRGEIE